MLSPPDSTLGKLLQQYVCARIVRMDRIDIGLFDFDRHNALYYFVLNADQQIYLRYGGRDSESATSYLNLRSLELALQAGLKMHASGEIPQVERPQQQRPADIPLIRSRTIERGACVECHLIADYQNIQRDLDNDLDRPRDMYRCPDIKTIGIDLDVPSGLKIDTATGSVAQAGMRAGDIITHIEHNRVRTFGDLQYYYDKVPRDSTELSIDVLRDKKPRSLIADSPELHIKLRHRAGSKVKLHVLRDQQKFVSELTTERQNFRKFVP